MRKKKKIKKLLHKLKLHQLKVKNLEKLRESFFKLVYAQATFILWRS